MCAKSNNRQVELKGGEKQELMSGAKRHEGASNYHTLVGPILSQIWLLQNAPYKVTAC